MPRRRFFEVQDFFQNVRPYEDVLTAPVHSDIAILYDYDSLASFRIQQQSILLDCEWEMKRLYGVFFRAGQMVDVIPAREDFSGYKLVVVPQMIVTDPAFVQRLKDYVAGGGVAVVTYRTAIKDRIPLAGQKPGTSGIFRDMIVPSTAEVLYRYDDEFYRSYAAVNRNVWGKGSAYYLGTTPDTDTLSDLLGQVLPRCNCPTAWNW